MQIYSEKGLMVGGIAIDPQKTCKAGHSVITHGHSDHVALAAGKRYVLSPETKAIVESRYGLQGECATLPFGKRLQLNGATVSLHNAGHILGSAQVLVEGSKTISVTSDFKMQDSLIQKAAVPLACDVLAIETTFGLPSYSFPKREEVYSELGAWVREKSKKGLAVLAGYSLGKAQELTAACNQYAGISPLVHESIAANNRVYEKEGVKLGDYIKLDHNLDESSVLILPPSLVKNHLLQALEHSINKKVFSALATGWGFRRGFDRAFPLSDHADFQQLMQYVKEAEPRLVLTMHGFEREFAGYVQRRLGIAAKPLGMQNQKTLGEFS